MGKQTATIEWQVAKDEEEWRQLYQPAMPVRQKERHLSGGLGEILVLILVVGGIGGWHWYTTHTEWQQAKSELTLVVQQEMTTEPTVRLRELPGDLAIINVTSASAANDGQTRLYRRTVMGWQRTVPDAQHWGLPQYLETASFRWHYCAQDAQAVAQAAPMAEMLYATLRHNFGLVTAPTGEKLVIEVSVRQQPGQIASVWDASERLIIPSPVLYQSPVELTDTDLLAQSLALPLLNLVVVQSSERYQLDSSWQPLLHGLRLWQLWDLDLPLAVWREDLVQWIYRDLPDAYVSERVVLPRQYAALCSAHALWMSSPLQIDIPLLCDDLDQESWYLATWGFHKPPLHLPQVVAPNLLNQPPELSNQTNQVNHRGYAIILATSMDYAVATYGRERLPALVAGLGQYHSWESLLPAVYGVSVAEFEAGWQQYLATHYGV